jgi:hypothetical protein
MTDSTESWVPFSGGELEGQMPKARCPRCRERLRARRIGAAAVPLCFQCYRAGLDRERALRAVADLDTATEHRFQYLLPLEPVNRQRLTMLRAERQASRTASLEGEGRFEARRRAAQITARRALQGLEEALKARHASAAERHRLMASAFHAAELQFPEAWLPFVIAG